MKKVLYTKYNSTRKPCYRIKTSIILDNNERYVIKQPMCKEAAGHIEAIKRNYQLLSDFSDNSKPVSYEIYQDGLKFPFIKGKGLIDNIDLINDSNDELIAALKQAAGLIFDVNNSNSKEFEMTKEFSEIFPDIEISDEISFKVSNLDAIFGNYIVEDDRLICIDYEWVFDFDIPVRFLMFRNLYYFYKDNRAAMEQRFSEEEYFALFDYSEKDISIFKKMDFCFQEYVHSQNVKYIYTSSHEKEFKKVSPSELELSLKENHINNLTTHIANLEDIISRQQQELERLRGYARATTPLFKCYRLYRKAKTKRDAR